MPTHTPRAEGIRRAVHNLWTLAAAIALDLGLCVVVMSVVLPGGQYWMIGSTLLGLHLPACVITGFIKRHSLRSRFITAACITAIACPLAPMALLLLSNLGKVPDYSGLFMWFPCSLFVPSVIFVLLCKKPSPPPDVCAACSYSLHGLTTSTCPECGTVQPTETPRS